MAAYKKQNTKDLYAILGVSRDADEGRIKKAYRKLAKKYHPDSNAGKPDAEKRFKDISEAYAILGDKEKRKIYDEFGFEAFSSGMDPKEYAKRMHEAEKAGFGGFGGSGYRGNGFGGFNRGGFGGFNEGGFGGFNGGGFSGFSRSDFNGNDSGGTGGNGSRNSGFFRSGDGSFTGFHYTGDGGSGSYRDFFEEMFRHPEEAGYGGSSGRSSVNLDLEIPVRISFREAVLGCERNLRLQKEDGSGTQTLRVHIPAGIDDGKSVRLRGKGHVSADGSRKGDLLLKVTVEESKTFSRKGRDLYTTASVPFATAVLGGEAEVQLPDGKKILCKVPKGTDAGKKIRIRGKGIHPEKGNAVAGDLYVTVQVLVPKDLTDAEVRKLREFETMVRSRTGEQSGKAYSA